MTARIYDGDLICASDSSFARPTKCGSGILSSWQSFHHELSCVDSTSLCRGERYLGENISQVGVNL